MTEKVKLAIHKGKDVELELGGLRFRACRREIGEIDGGITLKVMGPIGDEESEILRFDCFRKAPHFHAPGENPKETKIDPVAHGDGRDWACEQLSSNSPSLFAQAGWTPAAGELDLDALADLEFPLRSLMDDLPEPTETSYFEIDPALLDDRGAA